MHVVNPFLVFECVRNESQLLYNTPCTEFPFLNIRTHISTPLIYEFISMLYTAGTILKFPKH